MPLYFPSDEEVFAYRHPTEPVYTTFAVRGRDPHLPPPEVIIDGVRFEYDEFNTDRTRMLVRYHAEKRRLEAEQKQADTPKQ